MNSDKCLSLLLKYVQLYNVCPHLYLILSQIKDQLGN